MEAKNNIIDVTVTLPIISDLMFYCGSFYVNVYVQTQISIYKIDTIGFSRMNIFSHSIYVAHEISGFWSVKWTNKLLACLNTGNGNL